MFGLASRDAFAKRQSRWIRDVDESVRNNPSQRALNQELTLNPIQEKHNIISLTSPTILDIMNESISDSSVSRASNQNSMLREDNVNLYNRPNSEVNNIFRAENFVSKDEIETLHNVIKNLRRDNNDLQQRYSKLEHELELLRNRTSMGISLNDSSEITFRLNNIEQNYKVDHSNIITRITNLEYDNDRNTSKSSLSSIINRISSLEQSLSELSNQSNYELRANPVRNYNDCINNSSEFSAPTDPPEKDKIRVFIPYFIKEAYTGRDNKTLLNNNNIDMVVDIVGLFDDIPIIYPFGTATDLPHFTELNLDMQFVDAENSVNGTIYGTLTRRSDNIYTIRITELYSDGEASGIDKFTLPLTITCKTELLLE